MRAVRSMARANQNTNGATEAWHLTLKKMIKRKLGDIGGLRLDKIIDMLFTYMLPFFVYSLRRKQLGRVPNYRVEDVVLSSLHLAEFELNNAKVCTVVLLICLVVLMLHGCVFVNGCHYVY